MTLPGWADALLRAVAPDVPQDAICTDDFAAAAGVSRVHAERLLRDRVASGELQRARVRGKYLYWPTERSAE